MMNSDQKLSKKILNKVFFTNYCFGATAWNFESMDGPNSAWMYYPALKEIYGDDIEGLKKALHNHFAIYNTNFLVGGNTINGVVLALEEQKSEETADMVRSIKTSLMGPLAGVGDSLQNLAHNILGVFSAGFAQEGSTLGIIFGFVYAVITFLLERVLFFKSYEGGRNFVNKIAETMSVFLESASILGMTVVGAMIATNVSVSCGLSYQMGENIMAVSDVLDSILPKLIPVLSVSFGYWLLGRKKVTTSKMILIFLIIAVVLANFGILAR